MSSIWGLKLFRRLRNQAEAQVLRCDTGTSMAYNNLANDGSLQQFSELWESSRYSQRMSADPDSLGHMLEKTEHHLPDLSLCEMPPNRRRDMDEHRGIQRLDVQATDSTADDSTSSAGKTSKELREDEEDKHELLPKVGTPSWLSNALMRQQPQVSVSEGHGRVSGKWCSSCGVSGAHCMCRNMQTTSPSLSNHPYTDWLSAVPMGSSHPEDTSAEIPGREHQRVILGLHIMESGTGNEARSRNALNARGEHAQERDESMSLPPAVDRIKNWHEARLKAKLLTHPLFSQMLQAHVGCLKIATPVDQLPKIDEQLNQSQLVIDKYSVFAPEEGEDVDDKDELDDFMEQLQNHVRVHATEAMVGCWELEQQFYNLTGVSPGSGNGATMSDDDDEQAAESDGGGYETGLDVQDSTGGFGPLVPTETERSLMERVRQELKLELNEQGYREKIVDVREEILRKRRAGKLPEGTTTVLKTWWNAHSKWPYPTEDEKERLIQETGLELKQVNNWFINQRKRNWHSNPLSSSNELKNKRKT